jgi:hypothetical protein
LVSVATLIAAFAGDVLFTEWRVDWALKSVRIGDTHRHVLKVLGEPDNGPWSAGSCSNSGASCESWKLVHENYLTVCYDTAGRVTCREAYEVWH